MGKMAEDEMATFKFYDVRIKIAINSSTNEIYFIRGGYGKARAETYAQNNNKVMDPHPILEKGKILNLSLKLRYDKRLFGSLNDNPLVSSKSAIKTKPKKKKDDFDPIKQDLESKIGAINKTKERIKRKKTKPFVIWNILFELLDLNQRLNEKNKHSIFRHFDEEKFKKAIRTAFSKYHPDRYIKNDEYTQDLSNKVFKNINQLSVLYQYIIQYLAWSKENNKFYRSRTYRPAPYPENLFQ